MEPETWDSTVEPRCIAALLFQPILLYPSRAKIEPITLSRSVVALWMNSGVRAKPSWYLADQSIISIRTGTRSFPFWVREYSFWVFSASNTLDSITPLLSSRFSLSYKILLAILSIDFRKSLKNLLFSNIRSRITRNVHLSPKKSRA